MNRANDDDIIFENLPGEAEDTKKQTIDYNNSVYVFNSEDEDDEEGGDTNDGI